jgi:cytidine deaminase
MIKWRPLTAKDLNYMNSTQKQLFDKALQVRQRAHAPYSHFPVGASLLTKQGNIYSACNVENASYGLSLCAETNALTQMIANGDTQVAELLIIGGGKGLCAPCGACRQRLREFANDAALIHLCSSQGDIKTMTFGELFPLSFGPEDLS